MIESKAARVGLSAATGIDLVLRLTLVAALIFACSHVAAPFFGVMLWGTLLAVMMWPLHVWLRAKPGLGNAPGGMLADGLFVGPVLLGVDYVLFLGWVRDGPPA